MKRIGLVVVGALALAACDRTSPAQTARPSTAGAPAASHLDQLGPGVGLLAAVENARFALSKRDQVAAANDLNEARTYSDQLPDSAPGLFPAGGQTTAAGHATGSGASVTALSRITADGAQAKLLSARTNLLNNRLAEADADLDGLQRGVPQQLIPVELALLRARDSLRLAQLALASGRRPDARTQLMTAKAALDLYAGSHHAAEAKELATAIGQTLNQSDGMAKLPTDKPLFWSGMVEGFD